MHQPDTIGRERCAEGDVMGMLVRGVGFVGVDVAVSRFVVVAVGVGVEVTAPPAKEQPCGEEDYDHTDQSLRSLLHRPRQVTSQQHERKTDENQGCTVPKPQETPIEPAFLVPLPSCSDAMRVVTAVRWSGSEARRKPSARLTSSTTQRAGGPCKKASSQPSIVAIPSPFLHTTSLFRPAMRIRLTRKLGSQTLHL